jgi:hypothetical protein
VLIDRTHRPWAIVTAALLVIGAVGYMFYVSRVVRPGGGSWPGLAFGTAGFGMMLYAGLLGLRKRVRIWRVGRAQTWMRGHLWLATLSFPVILFHAGFSFGAGLTAVVMWIFLIVTVSGIFGAWLQHVMPRRLLRDVPMETIYEQIDHVRAQLLGEADTVVADACGKLEFETVAPGAVAAAPRTRPGITAGSAAAALASTDRLKAEESAPLRDFYAREMRAFIEHPKPDHPLAHGAHAALRFEKLRAVVPTLFHPAILDLENICEEERQLMRQSRMHALLHSWQLVHVPLSIALLVLAVVHVFVSLRY